MRRILLVNDDGPDSPGLRALAKGLAGLGELFVVTPDRWIGGCGKSITLLEPLWVRELQPPEGLRAFYTTSGTPADSFLIALELLGEAPDLLVSGINLGPNVGLEDLLHSGTLGAAIQAALHGVPALAVSYGPLRPGARPSGEKLARDLAVAAQIAAKLAKAVLEEGMPDEVSILSVNVPVGADPGKVALTKPLDVPFWKALRNEDGSFILVPWALTKLLDASEHTDVGALRRGYISITPIRLRVECNLSALEAFLARAGLVGA